MTQDFGVRPYFAKINFGIRAYLNKRSFEKPKIEVIARKIQVHFVEILQISVKYFLNEQKL